MRKGRLPHGHLRSLIRSYQSTFTVTRVSVSKDRVGDVTTTQTTHNEDMYVFSPSSNTVQMGVGEVDAGSLMALALSGADIQVDDRIDYGSDTYEVRSIDQMPDDTDTDYLKITLEKMENP